MTVVRSALDFLLIPSNLFFLLALVALIALIFRRIRLARGCLAGSLAGFFLFGYSSAAELMMIPLDTRFPPLDMDTAPPPDGIIVPGGMILTPYMDVRGTAIEFYGDGAEAVPTVAILARRFPEARIITSGEDEADGARRILMALGINLARIQIDPSSGSTAQRVRNVIELIGPDRDKTWWLVTSSYRMPRTIGAFRKAGLDPIAYPVDFRWIPPTLITWFYKLREGLMLTDLAAHEWAGLVFYRLTGKTDTLFPGPSNGSRKS